MQYGEGKLNVKFIDLGVARRFSEEWEAKQEMDVLRGILGMVEKVVEECEFVFGQVVMLF